MRKIDNLLFGTAGIPISTHGNTVSGINQVRKLGLDVMELEFVHGINISDQLAKEVKKASEQNNIILTSHAPYYINLNAKEAEKTQASVKRIILAAKRAFQCGAWSVAFHPGFYFNDNPEKVYEKIKTKIKEVSKALDNQGIQIWLRPETTGKLSAFGTLKEICRLSQEIDNVLPCVDFAHLHARSNGKENTLEEFRAQLELIEKMLGKTALNNMHCHISGIKYTDKGEQNHLELTKSDFNYRDLIKAWKEFKIKGVIINESPNIEKDALLLKGLYK